MLVKKMPAVPEKFVGELKMTGAEAREMESYAPKTPAVPMPQRRMKAKLEPATGLVTMFRKSGRSCSAAASIKGKVRVSRFMGLFQFMGWAGVCLAVGTAGFVLTKCVART